jgi:ribosomal protein S18 acetylase RimI-like enzyme
MLVFASKNLIKDFLEFDSSFQLVIKHDFFKKKYLLYDGFVLVHESTIFRFNRLSIFAGYFSYKVVGNCYTNPQYRGRGIYGNMVNYIRKNEAKFILFVEDDNQSSQKGLQKIGFEKIDSFKITLKLGLIYLLSRK